MDTSETKKEDSQVEDGNAELVAKEESVEEAKEGTEKKNDETEPEVIVENFENKEKEEKTGFFADLNATPDSMTKWLGIVGGVLAVAFIAIFSIDMFMGKDDPSKNLDVSKKQTQITPVQQQEKQQELPMPEVYGANEGTADSKKTPPIPTKPASTTAPTATSAPTKAPEPTATKAPDPTAVPTSVPPTDVPSTATPDPSTTP